VTREGDHVRLRRGGGRQVAGRLRRIGDDNRAGAAGGRGESLDGHSRAEHVRRDIDHEHARSVKEPDGLVHVDAPVGVA